MDTNTINTLKTAPAAVSNESPLFSGTNVIILVLVILVILSFLGINLLLVSGNVYEEVKKRFFPVIEKVLAMFGYSTGILLDKTAEASADAVKFSADVANGAVGSLSDLLITASKQKLEGGEQSALDNTLTFNKPLWKNAPKPDAAGSATQSQIASGKQKWCLVEETGDERKCLRVSEMGKCMSGQVFPNQKMCLNPNLSP